MKENGNAAEKMSVFERLNNLDLSEKSKEKNHLSYLPWSEAWGEVKKIYPDAQFYIKPQFMDDYGNSRPWHDDGKTGWVEVSVTIDDIEYTETLAIMDYKNKSIPVDQITSVDANKSIKRCLVKALALHGLGLYIYRGEDLPEEIAMINNLQEEVIEIAKRKSAISEEIKDKTIKLCIEAEIESNPGIDESSATGKISKITDAEVLKKLKDKILALRNTKK